EFLCIKGRYGFDFYDHPERLQTPLVRTNGKLEEVSWSKALEVVAQKFNKTIADQGTFGVTGSNHTTNEENFYLQKFAHRVVGTNNIDHHRTGDVVTLIDALSGKTAKLATVDDLYRSKAVLVLGADLALEHPMLSFQIRANFRHHQAHVYVVTEGPVREDKYAAASLRGGMEQLESLRERLAKEPEVVIVFGDTAQGQEGRRLVAFGDSLRIPVQYACLVDYSNSRGAIDMGLTPDPGGMNIEEMLATDLDVLWVVGANPLENRLKSVAHLVVQDMFLTETAQAADVVLPASSGYEKAGTITNVCGEVQRLKKGLQYMGTKPDLEIIGLIAREMGLAAVVGPWTPDAVFAEIRSTVHGYNIADPLIVAAQTAPVNGRVAISGRVEPIRSSRDNLFTSGTLGRYSKVLH